MQILRSLSIQITTERLGGMTRTVSPPTRPFALQVGAILGGALCRETVPILPPSLGASKSLQKRLALIFLKIKNLLKNFKKANFTKKKLFSTNGVKRLLYPKLFAGKKFTRNCVKKCGWPWKKGE